MAHVLRITSFVVIMMIFTGVGFYAYDYFLNTHEYVSIEERVFSTVDINLAAVTEDDEGMIIPMKVEIHEGNGKILVNIDNPSFVSDTQDSMRTATHEAARITGYNIETVDVLFSLDTGASIIGGPSAGAAMTVATIASLINRQVRSDVVITGQIIEGGAIGPVGGIAAKTAAAKELGATKILVPPGESIVQQEIEDCGDSSVPWAYNCITRYVDTPVEELVPGIEVIEISYVEDALEHMLE